MRIGIIGAMDEEIHYMRQALDIYGESVHVKGKYYEGTYGTKEVVLCKSGVGKVNAAITTQVLIDRFKVTHILFTGVAGALHPELEIGDIVISTSALQHDMDASALGPHFPQGMIPMFDYESDFTACPSLVELAEQAAAKIRDIHVRKGRILSGDQFIASRETVEKYFQQFDGACIEMEGSAVAQTAFLNDVPFVVIRSISDKANGEATVNFTEFTKLAAERSSSIVEEMLKTI
ncbi:5'-methylthioadenosine/adenosylhomocysteine nucleosidase [Fictibacillus sp. KU28468]|uniref:5'-methylthioadenosine/adenosylhomocysteine nucleosidase n=1 Tax=Fictibacillus sp. KU28468 TaxID=2991053 RepID=UPI00223D1FF1|nr:5'-methylthioadenosine/adenosylhomocysteine nucleosidase [Fictibacillus sp. KU28468]UZJ80273.1 5'-methylthioadenosine/adenosylhomocysteine nucleosidase [Fictibacillus sp. KU28468]